MSLITCKKQLFLFTKNQYFVQPSLARITAFARLGIKWNIFWMANCGIEFHSFSLRVHISFEFCGRSDYRPSLRAACPRYVPWYSSQAHTVAKERYENNTYFLPNVVEHCPVLTKSQELNIELTEAPSIRNSSKFHYSLGWYFKTQAIVPLVNVFSRSSLNQCLPILHRKIISRLIREHNTVRFFPERESFQAPIKTKSMTFTDQKNLDSKQTSMYDSCRSRYPHYYPPYLPHLLLC